MYKKSDKIDLHDCEFIPFAACISVAGVGAACVVVVVVVGGCVFWVVAIVGGGAAWVVVVVVVVVVAGQSSIPITVIRVEILITFR
jgi:hypothetical protein